MKAKKIAIETLKANRSMARSADRSVYIAIGSLIIAAISLAGFLYNCRNLNLSKR